MLRSAKGGLHGFVNFRVLWVFIFKGCVHADGNTGVPNMGAFHIFIELSQHGTNTMIKVKFY